MLQKVKANWKQLLVSALSLVCAVILHLHPEWHDYVILFAGALGSIGITLWPIALNANTAKAIAMAKVVSKTGNFPWSPKLSNLLPDLAPRDSSPTATEEK